MLLDPRKKKLIERLMAIKEPDVLKSLEKVLEEADYIARQEESMEAIRKGDTLTIDEFSASNKEWLRSRGLA